MDRYERRKQASRARILDAAFALFRAQGVEATTIEQICEQADVANRTFFNHFAKRDDMVRALALERLRHLGEVLTERLTVDDAAFDLAALFDDIARFLESSGPTYRELVATMLTLAGSGTERSGELHGAVLALVKHGVARGEVTARHDPAVLTDIVVGGLVVALMNWTADDTYGIRTGLGGVADALSDLLAP